MTSTVFLIGTAASLLALVIRRERRRYRERTQVCRIKVTLVPFTDGTCVGVAYSPEDSGEPRWT